MALRREDWRDDDDDDDEHDLDVDDGAAFSISISFHFSCLIVALVAIGSILLAASAGDLASVMQLGDAAVSSSASTSIPAASPSSTISATG